MTFTEFLEMRIKTSEMNRDEHEVDSRNWSYWQGRTLSYQECLKAKLGTKLVVKPGTPSDQSFVEPA